MIENNIKLKKCVFCHKSSNMDVCIDCANLMTEKNVRRKVYDTRYYQYSVDHGKMNYTFLDDYINIDTKCLELGGGAGHLSAHCSKLSNFVVTTDFSKTMVYRSYSSYPNLMALIGDAECSIPFKDSSFDVVISTDVLEHLYDLPGHLSEVNRLLKNDGFYIIKTPNKLFDDFCLIFKKDKYYHKAFHYSTQSYIGLKELLKKFVFETHFLHMVDLSDTQQKKIRPRFVRDIIEYILPQIPVLFQPSFICIAKKSKQIEIREP